MFATVFIAPFPIGIGQSIPCCIVKYLNSVSVWSWKWQPAGWETYSKWQHRVCWAWILEFSASFIRFLMSSKRVLYSERGWKFCLMEKKILSVCKYHEPLLFIGGGGDMGGSMRPGCMTTGWDLTPQHCCGMSPHGMPFPHNSSANITNERLGLDPIEGRSSLIGTFEL